MENPSLSTEKAPEISNTPSSSIEETPKDAAVSVAVVESKKTKQKKKKQKKSATELALAASAPAAEEIGIAHISCLIFTAWSNSSSLAVNLVPTEDMSAWTTLGVSGLFHLFL